MYKLFGQGFNSPHLHKSHEIKEKMYYIVKHETDDLYLDFSYDSGGISSMILKDKLFHAHVFNQYTEALKWKTHINDEGYGMAIGFIGFWVVHQVFITLNKQETKPVPVFTHTNELLEKLKLIQLYGRDRDIIRQNSNRDLEW